MADSTYNTWDPNEMPASAPWETWDPSGAPTQNLNMENGADTQNAPFNLDAGWLSTMGYDGNPQTNYGDNTDSHAQGNSTSPELMKWLNDNGRSLQMSSSDENHGSKFLGRMVDSNGRQIGQGQQWGDINSDAFGLAALAAGGFAGAAAMGAGAGAAGAGAGAGEGGSLSAADEMMANAAASDAGGGSIGASSSSGLEAMGTGAAKGAAINAGSTKLQGGTWGDTLKAGAIGGVTGGVGGAISAYNPAGEMGVTGSTSQGIVNGAIQGGVSSAAQGGNPLLGAAGGGAAGGLGSANVGGQVSDNPYLSRGINSALTSGTSAAINGGNVGSAVLGSAEGTAANAGFGYAKGAIMPYFNNNSAPGESTSPYPNSDPSQWSPTPNMSTPIGQGADPLLSMFTGASTEPNQNFSPQAQGPSAGTLDLGNSNPNVDRKTAQSGNPVMDTFMGGIHSLSDAAGGANGANMGANLMDMYNRYKTNQRQSALASNLSSMYSQNSPYANQLRQTLMRQDAASGRRSQVGPREVELQARLADSNARMAPTLNTIYGQMGQNRVGMGNDIYRSLAGGPNGGGGAGMIMNAGRSLNNYFNPPTPQVPQGDGNDIGLGYADGGPVVGTRSPVRTGGGGGLSSSAIMAALAASAPASSASGIGSLPANPLTDPKAILEDRMRKAGAFATGGSVYGPGTSRSDSIPARLSTGEHVIDAASVNAIGGGNNAVGQARLNAMRAKLHGKG